MGTDDNNERGERGEGSEQRSRWNGRHEQARAKSRAHPDAGGLSRRVALSWLLSRPRLVTCVQNEAISCKQAVDSGNALRS